MVCLNNGMHRARRRAEEVHNLRRTLSDNCVARDGKGELIIRVLGCVVLDKYVPSPNYNLRTDILRVNELARMFCFCKSQPFPEKEYRVWVFKLCAFHLARAFLSYIRVFFSTTKPWNFCTLIYRLIVHLRSSSQLSDVCSG